MTTDRTDCTDVLTLLTRHDPIAPEADAEPGAGGTTAEDAALVRIRAALDQATAATVDATRPNRARRGRRSRRSWAAALVPVAAVAAAAVTAVLLVDGGAAPAGPTDDPAGDRAAVPVAVAPGDPAAAPVFLGELATAVAASTAPVPRPDQFVYVHSLTASIDLTPAYEGTGPAVDEGLLDREVWLPQGADGGVGLIREDGRDTRLNPELGSGPGPGRYAELAALPIDPQVLLAQLTATAVGAEVDPSFAVFTTIRDLLAESLAPPATTAALYQAAALVPGIELVPGAEDAAGRSGTGIALVRDGQRTELVFDPENGSYLGARSYYEQDSRWGPAGTLTGLTAVLARGVSDTAGTTPTGADLAD